MLNEKSQRHMKKKRRKKLEVIEQQNSNRVTVFYKKIMEANKLIAEESNRLVSWSLTIIGGTVLMIISTSYVDPKGGILYSYFLFVFGWFFHGASIYFGEMLTRIYIAGAIATEEDVERIRKIGLEVHQKFSRQITYFQIGTSIFALWLVTFLIWFILFKEH